ncbi:MAG: EamA family transporter [Gammaproteobacteria bacterium]
MSTGASGPTRIQMLAAWAIVYGVWSSTYLAIRIAVADIPPGLLAGIRFFTAGLLLIGIARLRGASLPTDGRAWRVIVVMGIALVAVGNGAVTWAEQWVPSNQAALLIASSAFWMAWFGSFGPKGVPIRRGTWLGIAIGFVGVILLLQPQGPTDLEQLLPMAAIVCSSLFWCGGSIYGRNAGLEMSPMMFAGCQMLVGGAVLWIGGIAAGEPARVEWTAPGIIGLVYLTLFGSCLAYGTYIWLIRQTSPARLSTIAYVTPAFATVLGWWVLDETLTGTQLAGMFFTLIGVIVVARTSRA